MAQLPKSVVGLPLGVEGRPFIDEATELGWTLWHQGKVRDTYSSEDNSNLLVVATDRISIFDFVLKAQVPSKGEVLTALTHFWLNLVLTDTPNHLMGVPTDNELPRERCLLVKKVDMAPYEMIFRGHIGGSVWKEYLKSGTAGGIKLPEGLNRWDELVEPIFTPSTKAESGHDENITANDFLAATGWNGHVAINALIDAYKKAYTYAARRGIAILDTKFEVGLDPFVLADEVLTPDSSRFAVIDDLAAAISEGRDPRSFDKDPVRAWGRTVQTPFDVVGINNLNPADDAHLNFVHNELEVPQEVIEETTRRYLQLFQILTDSTLAEYQLREMKIFS